MSQHFFTAEGTFGPATLDDHVVLDTSKWTDEMWDTIDHASDDERMYVAISFDNQINNGGEK